jgi:hypothetical protein
MEIKSECRKIMEPQTIDLVNKIRAKGKNVISLNPFINFNFEGNNFKEA